LRKYTYVVPSEFFVLIAWLTAALCTAAPYPILVLACERGPAKSTLARVDNFLIDSRSWPLRSEPRSCRHLRVGAVNNSLLALNNLSSMPRRLSCRLATGGSFAARKLYNDYQEHGWSECRAVVVDGIGSLARRGDLIDRSLFLNLPPIPHSRIQCEKDLWTAFQADYPLLLGGLLDAMTGGLAKLAEIKLCARLRMANFARCGETVSPAVGQGAEDVPLGIPRQPPRSQPLLARRFPRGACGLSAREIDSTLEPNTHRSPRAALQSRGRSHIRDETLAQQCRMALRQPPPPAPRFPRHRCDHHVRSRPEEQAHQDSTASCADPIHRVPRLPRVAAA
jgi:hypothetical protein